jgi:type II secretory pathway component PulM
MATTLFMKSGPLAALDRLLETLSPRDRRLFVGLVVFGTGVLLLGFWWVLHGMLASEASRVREAKEHLSRMLDLQTEYNAATARFDAQRDRLAESTSKPVSAFIEELATEHGLNQQLSAVRQQQTEEIGDVAQTRYTVELKKAMQEPLYRFLYALETSGYPARVEQATFKTTPVKGEKLMDLTLELVVLSVKQGP